ncbi:MAG TPA: hypothetical protein VFR65_01235 [Nitrososphaeraceae archaeon]|nr:hypothetical protein [Nitrososphaeraceae archaeon]
MLRNLGIFFLGIVFLVTLNLTFSFIGTVMAQESEILSKITNDNKQDKHDDDKLVVVAQINLKDTERNGFLKVVGVINGEDFVKTIPLDKLKETTKKLKVKFSMDKENEIVSASKPDEFFVCAYHVKNTDTKITSYDKQGIIEYFDCNEGDIKSTTSPTQISLFKLTSQVYNKTSTYYNLHSKPQVLSFATLANDSTKTSKDVANLKTDIANSGDKDSSNKPVKVKIIVPMEDKKDAKKIKVMAMLKGQIKSEIIDDVQKEFDKIGGYTIERTFAFDRNTDIGPIQIGDRYHACVIGQDLNPPEGSECEKRLIKHLDKTNALAAR